MAKEILVQCQICGRICSPIEAVTHWKLQNHNSWKIILPDLSYIGKEVKDD